MSFEPNRDLHPKSAVIEPAAGPKHHNRRPHRAGEPPVRFGPTESSYQPCRARSNGSTASARGKTGGESRRDGLPGLVLDIEELPARVNFQKDVAPILG